MILSDSFNIWSILVWVQLLAFSYLNCDFSWFYGRWFLNCFLDILYVMLGDSGFSLNSLNLAGSCPVYIQHTDPGLHLWMVIPMTGRFSEPFLVILVCWVYLGQTHAARGGGRSFPGWTQDVAQWRMWVLRSWGKENTFPWLLIIGVVPHQSPLLVVLELPDVGGTSVGFMGDEWATRLLSFARLEFREWWAWLPSCVGLETWDALLLIPLVLGPQTNLPS